VNQLIAQLINRENESNPLPSLAYRIKTIRKEERKKRFSWITTI